MIRRTGGGLKVKGLGLEFEGGFVLYQTIDLRKLKRRTCTNFHKKIWEKQDSHVF